MPLLLVMSQAVSAQHIVSVRQIAQLTGQPSLNNTGQVNVYGTDLGSMFSHSDGKVYFLFGDTFGQPGTPGASGDWRSNTMAYTTDFSAADGITFDGWITAPSGQAKALVEGAHDPNDGSGEVTKIPTAGWSIQGRQFMWFMSVKQWGAAGQWDVNFAEIAYSDDDGNTWVRSGSRRSGDSHFIHVAVAEHAGYLYVWGIPSGRFGGVKIARVLLPEVLDNAAYQYYTGTTWSSNEAEAALIVDAPVGELSVLWNPYLQRWIMMYLNENRACIEVREAEQPQGSWRASVPVVCGTDYPALYGAYMHPTYIEQEGKTVYFLMSQWGPYNVFLMQVEFQRNTTGVGEAEPSEVPASYALHQNYPNPFNPETRIRYALPASGRVVLTVFNPAGEKVRTLVDQFRPAGSYEILWDGKDDLRRPVASGVYVYALQVGGVEMQTREMVLLR